MVVYPKSQHALMHYPHGCTLLGARVWTSVFMGLRYQGLFAWQSIAEAMLWVF